MPTLSLPKHLPKPNQAIVDHHQQFARKLAQQIKNSGAMPFSHFMEACLFDREFGYYRRRRNPIGGQGDFTTAPELSPLFSYCLAKQCHLILSTMANRNILEFGAGSGRMASDILTYLRDINALPDQYIILEPSHNLQQQQQATLGKHHPDLLDRITWLSHLPESFSGVIIANEVLDAMPVERVQYHNNAWQRSMVNFQENEQTFTWDTSPIDSIQSTADAIKTSNIPGIEGYTTELNPQIKPWLQALNETLDCGVILLIDYGFPRHEYYHPQRHMGTLMCHFQHYAHSDPLTLLGCQDITAHIDFTSVAEAALDLKLDLIGYCQQAAFLLSLGLIEMAEARMTPPETTKSESENKINHWQTSQAIKKLTLPSEMGELFKVIALGKRFDDDLLGFSLINQREKLFSQESF